MPVAPLRFEYGRQTALVTHVSGVEDMRDMVEGDVRFSRQFGMEI